MCVRRMKRAVTIARGMTLRTSASIPMQAQTAKDSKAAYRFFDTAAVTFEALIPMPLFLLGWLAMAADLSGLTSGRRDGIDHFAHLGGYLSVLFLWFLLPPKQTRRLHAGLIINLATAVCAALIWFVWLGPALARR